MTPASITRAQNSTTPIPFERAWAIIERHGAVVIFAVALLLRVALLLWTGAFRETEPTEAINVAHSLVQHGSFANPNPAVETGPTATIPPVYPFFLSLLLRLTGDGVAFALIRRFLAAMATSVQ